MVHLSTPAGLPGVLIPSRVNRTKPISSTEPYFYETVTPSTTPGVTYTHTRTVYPSPTASTISTPSSCLTSATTPTPFPPAIHTYSPGTSTPTQMSFWLQLDVFEEFLLTVYAGRA